MASNTAVTLLFSQASARIDQSLALISEFNEIAETLESLGHSCAAHEKLRPILSLIASSSGRESAADSEILSELLAGGPRQVKNGAISIKRRALVAERSRLGEESGWACFYCRLQGSSDLGPDSRIWHVDHAYPISRGGDDMPDNHVLACATCNLEKSARTSAEYFQFIMAEVRTIARQEARIVVAESRAVDLEETA